VHYLIAEVERVGGGRPVHMLAHDWGCLFSVLMAERRPELVARMAMLDVGGAMQPGLVSAAFILAYQVRFASVQVLHSGCVSIYHRYTL
jgi:pimeloyl-ACP methyl ester carboxylesterase